MKISMSLFAVIAWVLASVLPAAAITWQGETRACAGGVDDAVHTLTVTVTMPDKRPVTFALPRSQARFIVRQAKAAPREVATVTSAAGARGDIVLEIRCRRPETPVIVARRGKSEVGRLQLDFGEPVLYRRSTGPEDYPGEDSGFSFAMEGDNVTAHYKFRSSWQRGDVNGNWQPVAGHKLRIYVPQVDDRVGIGKVLHKPEEIAKYARITNPAAPNAKECIVTTRADGSAEFRLQSLNYDAHLALDAEDLTAPRNPQYRPPGVPVTRTLPEYAGKFAGIHWFEAPADIHLSAVWQETPSAKRGAPGWRWSDVAGGRHTPPRAVPPLTTNVEANYSAVRAVAPGGDRVLFYSPGAGDFDSAHHCIIAPLTGGKAVMWRRQLYGESEVWSPDGKRIAYVAGSLHPVGSQSMDPPLRLMVRSAQPPAETANGSRKRPAGETLLAADNTIMSGALVWTSNGDLLVSNKSLLGKSTPGQQQEVIARIMRYRNGAGNPLLWQSRAAAPVPAPDGKRIAFIGPEQGTDKGWADASPALCVASASGTGRRTLTRLSQGETRTFFMPDNRHVLLYSFRNNYGLDSYVMSAAYSKQKSDLEPIAVSIALVQFDTVTGERRQLADLSATYRPWAPQNPPGVHDFPPLGFSRDGRYFYLARREIRDSGSGYGETVAHTIFAIRLRDAAVLPVVCFPRGGAILPR